MKTIAYTDHNSKAPPLSNLVFFQLRTAFTIALLNCLACSKVKLSWVFLNVIQQTLWRDLIFDNSKNGDIYGILIKLCRSFDISLFKTTVVLRDWKSTKFVEICIPLHSGSLLTVFVSSCHPLAFVPTLPKNKKTKKKKRKKKQVNQPPLSYPTSLCKMNAFLFPFSFCIVICTISYLYSG